MYLYNRIFSSEKGRQVKHKKLLKRMKHLAERGLLWSMIAGVSLPSVVEFFPRVAYAAEKTSTGFYYPTKTDNLGPYAGFLANDCGVSGYGEYHPTDVPSSRHLFHIGKDIAGNAGDAVYAISDGVVEDLQDGDVYGWGHGNVGLVIRHTLSDGKTTFLTLDGHVRTNLKIGDKVFAGTQTATIGDFSPPHDHWGIVLPGHDMPLHELGRIDCNIWPSSSLIPTRTNGFTDPIEFIQTHAPLNVKSLPTGSLVTVPGDNAPVYRLSKNNRLQHIDSPETFTQKGFDWARVMNVSGEFLTCYAKGGDITKTAGIENPSPWFRKDASGVPFEQYNEAKLLRFSGSDNVYIVADGKLHWLHISEKEFYSLGYHAQWIEDIMGNPPTSSDIGDEWGIERFTKCPNVPLAGLGGELTMSARTPLPYGHYDVDPFVIPYRLNDTNNVSPFSSK